MIEGKGSWMVQLSDVFFSAGVSLYYYQLPQLPDTIFSRRGSFRVRSTNGLRVTPPILMKFGTLADNA